MAQGRPVLETVPSAPADAELTTPTGRLRLTPITALLVIAPALLQLRFTGNLAIADIVLVPAAAYGILIGATYVPGWRTLASRIALGYWAIVTGSLIAILNGEPRLSGLAALIRDLTVLVYFLGVLAVLYKWRPPPRATASLLAATTVVVAAAAWIDRGDYRGDAGFGNPNLTGHYLAISATLVIASVRGWQRYVAAASLLVGLLATASFGAMASIALAVVYVAYVKLRRHGPGPVLFAGAIGVGLLGTLLLSDDGVPEPTAAGQETVISTQRVNRSGDSRFDLWQAAVDAWRGDLLGIGPGEFAARRYVVINYSDGTSFGNEIHNEYLSFLVERGPLGLFGLGAIAVGIWRYAPSGGAARIIMVEAAAAAMFRETLHFRHLWVFLAFALVFDRMDPSYLRSRGDP